MLKKSVHFSTQGEGRGGGEEEGGGVDAKKKCPAFRVLLKLMNWKTLKPTKNYI